MKRSNRVISLLGKNTFSKISLFTRLYSLHNISKITKSQIIWSNTYTSTFLNNNYHTSRSLLSEGGAPFGNRPAFRTDQDRTVHISNLPPSASQSELESLFEHVDGYVSVRVIFDAFSGRCRGFAFVTFESPEQAKKLIEESPKIEYQGNLIKISEAMAFDRANSVYIGNLPWEVSPEKVTQALAKFGKVVRVNLPKRFDGRGRGFAFVYFGDRQSAEKAIIQGNITIEDRQALISAPVAKNREQGFSTDRKEDDALEL